MKIAEDLCKALSQIADQDLEKWCVMFERYRDGFNTISPLLYDKLCPEDQRRFITWMLKRWAGIHTVNAVEYGLYLNRIEFTKNEPCELIELHGKNYTLRDLRSQGHDFKLLAYDWVLGVHDIYYNQYEHQRCRLEKGDVIIDAGAFIGDTAVLFNHKLQGDCEIHCFELLDESLALLQYNLAINQLQNSKITINKLALSEKSEQTIHIKKGATQGGTSMYGQADSEQAVETIALDDYVRIMNLERVDFIKMDIEGAEIPALKGAIETIRHFRPRLALCLYHRWDDIMTIPKLLAATGVDYEFEFKWVELSRGWEAVLLASPTSMRDSGTTVPSPACTDESASPWLIQALSRINIKLLQVQLQYSRKPSPQPVHP